MMKKRETNYEKERTNNEHLWKIGKNKETWWNIEEQINEKWLARGKQTMKTRETTMKNDETNEKQWQMMKKRENNNGKMMRR